MNAIFFTQSHSLDMFFRLAKLLQAQGKIDQASFYVTDLFYFERFCKKNPDILSFPLLKEWEIVQKGKKRTPDISKLKEYEGEFGDPYLWPSVISDRRIFLGKKSAFHQDYYSDFNYQEMLGILQEATGQIKGLFDRVNPEYIFSFICVTIGDYLGYMIANKRKIRYFNLRPTRIKNYVYFADTIFEPPGNFVEKYIRMNHSKTNGDFEREARLFLSKVQKQELFYEGVFIGKRNKITSKVKESKFLNNIRKIYWEFEYRFRKYKNDNHNNGFFYPPFYNRVLKPLKVKWIHWALRKHYLAKEDVRKADYAFYPLHKEPEYILFVYNRYSLNQIEVVRNIAQSLPIGMKLLVKEHPASIGYRTVSYYKKLLKIPNVALVDPRIKGRFVIENSKLVALLGGTVGFEALLLKKPVIVIGHALYEVISSGMIEKVKDLNELPVIIKRMITHYRYDEEKLIQFIHCVMVNSVKVDLYTKLLQKKSGYQINEKDSVDEQVEKLMNYVLKNIEDSKQGEVNINP